MKYIEEPTACPCCDYILEKINDQLFCRNTSCSAQALKKLEHFCKVLGIKGLGPKTIEKLDIQEPVEIYYLDSKILINVLGEKLGNKLLVEIEASKKADLSTVLEAFSIPLIGGTASKKIASTVNNIDAITLEVLKTAGLGAKASDNLLEWINTEYKELKDFLPFNFSSVKQVYNKTVCITGKLKNFKNKAEATIALNKAGYRVVDDITKSVDILVDEGDQTSSKYEKAVKYGITIITDLQDLLERN